MTGAAELQKLEERFAADKPVLELTVRDSALNVEGYVVVWNTEPGRGGPLGPFGKGGTRITPTASLEEIRMLAQRMALKNAAAGLAMGGAKSGLRADPEQPGFEQIYRRFARLVSPILLENGGVFGGFGFDIGGRPEHPRWLVDELRSFRCVTGKPLDLGGTDYDREGIAGLGVAVAAQAAVRFAGADIANLRCTIQGMGAMGAAVFRYLMELGARVTAISDPRLGGTFVLPHTISPLLSKSLIEQDFRTSAELLKDSAALPLDDVLYLDTDILFPCAVQDVIRMNNVSRISTRWLIEGANSPCTAEAMNSLAERGVVQIPDFIANPGGVIAAFVELTMDISPEENLRTRAKPEEAKRLTRKKIAENVEQTLQLAREQQMPIGSAAKLVALRNMYGG